MSSPVFFFVSWTLVAFIGSNGPGNPTVSVPVLSAKVECFLKAGEGVGLLAVYSLGLGVPFLVSGLLFHHFLTALNRFRKYIRLAEIGAGVMLMAVGVMLMFNLMGQLTRIIYQWMPV